MKALWAKVEAKIDALSVRERVIAFVAATVVGVYLVFALAIEPVQKRQQSRLAQIAQQKAQIAAFESGRGGAQVALVDPDAANRVRGEALQREVGELDEKLKTMHRELVAAERMTPLLREMLAADSGLQLVALRTLPAEALMSRGAVPEAKTAAPGGAAPAKAVAADDASVFKHGVEITLQGSYANLHDYLLRLERAPWRMFWWRGRLAADEHARLTLTITIYTLSLDKAWLQV